METPQHVAGRCGACRHFRNDPAEMERVFAGLTSLSSGYASVRANDGVCTHHGRYLRASAHCADFTSRAPKVA